MLIKKDLCTLVVFQENAKTTAIATHTRAAKKLEQVMRCQDNWEITSW